MEDMKSVLKLKSNRYFRRYQLDIMTRHIYLKYGFGIPKLWKFKNLGKTITSLGIAQKLFMNNVLFVTKKSYQLLKMITSC